MSRRPPHQSTPHGSRKLPEPPRMNAASNNPGQSAPADQQQGLPLPDLYWRSPAEIDALAAAQRDRPTIPTNEDWRSDRGRAGGLTSTTPLPADPYYQQDQSHRSEVRRYGSYGDPPYRGFPSTAPPANPNPYQDQSRQSEILETGEYGSYGEPPSRGFPSTAPPANLPSYQDQNRQGDISRGTGLENDEQPWTPFLHNELASKIMAKKTWEVIASEMRRDVKKLQDKWWRIKDGYKGVEYSPGGKPRKQREKKEKKKPRGGR